jgi:DNA-binding NarL/FixJ family response regulator
MNGQKHLSVIIGDGNEWYLNKIQSMMSETFVDVDCSLCRTGEQIVNLCSCSQQDIIFIDYSIVGIHALDVIKELRSKKVTGKIMMTSFYNDSIYGEKAIEAGADGFIVKDIFFEFLAKEIQRASSTHPVS